MAGLELFSARADLAPITGYPGGKRRLVPRIRPLIPLDGLRLYAEPFVGMGAVYLDLRARGYVGPAILADANPSVAELWRVVHDPGLAPRLASAAHDLLQRPATVESFFAMKDEPVGDAPARAARFLWLTNYTFGNQPPTYLDERWSGRGTKLSSAAKWGKTFPWSDCVKRLDAAVSALAGLPCEVAPDGLPVLDSLPANAVCYADPPYASTERYVRGQARDCAERIFRCGARTIFSEQADLRELMPAGWSAHSGEVVARQSGQQGAKGRRAEWLYVSG